MYTIILIFFLQFNSFVILATIINARNLRYQSLDLFPSTKITTYVRQSALPYLIGLTKPVGMFVGNTGTSSNAAV